MAASKVELQPVNAGGWLMGFTNVFRKENSEWWGTRTWLVHSYSYPHCQDHELAKLSSEN